MIANSPVHKSSWLSRQILPQANPYVSWLRGPLGWLIVATIGSLLVAVSLAPQMWLVFAVLVTLILIGVLWPLLAISAVSCELQFSRKRCREQDLVLVSLMVTNRFWIPVWGLTLENGFWGSQDSDKGTDVAIALARVPAASTTEFQWEFRPGVRGVYPTVQPSVCSAFPFGIWSARKPLHRVSHLIVWPQVVRLGSIPPARGENELVSETFIDRSGTVGDRIGVRPYQVGDPLRLIRWSHTARYDQLIVSEQQSPSREIVTVVIDLESHDNEVFGNGRPSMRDNAEQCIRVACSVVTEFHSHGYLVQFRFGDIVSTIDARGLSYRNWMDQVAGFRVESDPAVSANAPFSIDSQLGFRVTNGWDRALATRSDNLKTILIGCDVNEHGEKSSGKKPWLTLNEPDQALEKFPRVWVKKCQASWQVTK